MMDNWVIRRIEETTPLGLPLDAGSMLLFELDGTQSAVDKDVESVIKSCQQAGALNVRAAKDDVEAANFWTARRAGFSAIYGASPNIFAEDVTVPISRIADLIDKVQQIAKKYDLTIVIIGHAGDGNLHPSVLTIRKTRNIMPVQKKPWTKFSWRRWSTVGRFPESTASGWRKAFHETGNAA